MAGSAFSPVFRRICGPFLFANKQRAFAAIQSRLFSISSTQLEGKWIQPFGCAGVPRVFGRGPLQIGNLPHNSRHYAKVPPRDLSEDEDSSDESSGDEEVDLEDGGLPEEGEIDDEDDDEYTDSD